MRHTEIYKSDLMSCTADTSHLNIHYSSRSEGPFSFIYCIRLKSAFDILITALMPQYSAFHELYLTVSMLTGFSAENAIKEYKQPANFTVVGSPCCRRSKDEPGSLSERMSNCPCCSASC